MKISVLKLACFSIAVMALIFASLGGAQAAPAASQPNLSGQLDLADLPPEAQRAIVSSIQRGKLTASDGAISDQLGWAVAISGDGRTIVVGAPLGDDSIANQGAAYVFVRSGAGWGTMTQTAKLTNAYGAAYEWFGSSVAISADGGVIVVGAFNSSINVSSKEGAAFVYVKPVSGWTTTSLYTSRLASSHRADQDMLGYSVAVSADGSTIVAGAYAYDNNATDSGGAYVYVKPVSGWGGSDPMYQAGELLASGPLMNDRFGFSVAISGDANTIIVGAPNVDDGLMQDVGAAYVFVKPGGGWTNLTQTAKLVSAGGAAGDVFGSSVSISDDGNTIAAGAPKSDLTKGQAFIFVKPGGGWVGMSQNAKLNASDGATNDGLGTSVSISGDGTLVAAGADGAEIGINADQGAAYTFARPAGGWTGNLTQTAKLTASDGGAGDGFGLSISVNDAGESLAVGASKDNISLHADQGSAYEFAMMKKVTLRSLGTHDGWVLESSEFSNVGGSLNSIATTFNLGDNAARKQYRGVLSFNTGASLPDGAVIASVLLRVRKSAVVGGGDPLSMFTGFMVDVKKGFFGSNAGLQAEDFQSPAGKTVGPLSPVLISSWYSLNLTSAKALINKLAGSGGLTQIRLRFKLDDNNNAIDNYLRLLSGNAAAAARPQLIIQYYVP